MFKSKPFHIPSYRRAKINEVESKDVLLALLEKYKYNIEINPNNNKEAYREFFRKHKIAVWKKELIFNLLNEDAFQYIVKSNTDLNTLLALSKEVDKYLVYLWQEDLL